MEEKTLDHLMDYFRTYDNKTYEVVACMGNEPSEEDIAAFEAHFGITLPEDFRRFTMSPLGGMLMEVREAFWPQAQAFDVGPFWSFLRGFMVFGIAKEIPEFLDIRQQTAQLREQGIEEYVPFLQLIGNGDSVYCFDQTHQIVELDFTSGETTAINLSFPQLLLQEIAQLEERKNKKMQGLDKTE